MIVVFFAPGFEEVEALTVVDVLRRAGKEVVCAGVGACQITGSHNICVVCDCEVGQISPNPKLEAVVLPGGMPGTKNLEKSTQVKAFIEYAYQNDLYICAICAAPSVLGHMGLLSGRRAVCFPGFEKDMIGAVPVKENVCRDGNLITAKGMGCAIDFSIEIARLFIGNQQTIKLRESLQCP